MGQRQAIVDETRERILAAARALLADPSGYKSFTVDAVAQAADVARPTVYYQFGSKRGLIEALCDDLAAAGRMDDMATVFSEPDPLVSLERLVAVFARFWASDRPVTRRLRALAALDPDIGQVISARDERRREALGVLVGRFGAALPGSAALPGGAGLPEGTALSGPVGQPGGTALPGGTELPGGTGRDTAAVVDVLQALTSFETFDVIAGAEGDVDYVVRAILPLLPAALALT